MRASVIPPCVSPQLIHTGGCYGHLWVGIRVCREVEVSVGTPLLLHAHLSGHRSGHASPPGHLTSAPIAHLTSPEIPQLAKPQSPRTTNVTGETFLYG